MLILTVAFDAVLADAGLAVVKSGVRMPRMNSITETGPSAAPLHPLPDPITDPAQLTRLDVLRQDRLGGTLHEYRHAA